MSQRAVDHRPDLRLAAALVGVTFGSCAALVAWAWSVRDRLPDPVARHWNASGAADGFSSLTSSMTVTVVLLLVISVPLGATAVLSRQPATLRRCLAGTSAWLAVFMTALVADSLRGQLDLVDPSEAPLPGLGILIGTVGGLAVAVAVGVLARSDGATARATGPPPPSARRLADPPPAPTWSSGGAALDVGAKITSLLATSGLILLSAVLTWWLLPFALLIGGLLAGAGRVSTEIGPEGLRVRALGLPLLSVPLDDVVAADTVDVDPLWEFGGWGLRVDMSGRTGVVTRKGPALRVRRGDGSEVLVTVDDADDAAATLNTLADRRSQAPPRHPHEAN